MTKTRLRHASVPERRQRPDLRIILAGFKAHLRKLGYTSIATAAYCGAAEHFTAWQIRCHHNLSAMDEHRIGLFVTRHLPRCRCRGRTPRYAPKVQSALRRLLRFLQDNGWSSPAAARPQPCWASVLSKYDRYMSEVGGLSEATRCYRMRYARQFLTWRFNEQRARWSDIAPKDVIAFIRLQTKRFSLASVNLIADSLRGFLRYLCSQGLCRSHLVQAVPSVAVWGQTTLPRTLTVDQCRDLLRSFDRKSALGRRDLAVALCQLELGLRAGEVAHLALDDLDWRRGTVRIRGAKGQRERVLPLPDRLGQALAAHLRNGRPETTTRAVFVRHRAPVGASLSVSQVRHAMCRAYRRCGFDPTWKGTHLLRHTFATRLHQRGAALKEIADLLGHRDLNTTTIYTRINLAQLRQVALPWPDKFP